MIKSQLFKVGDYVKYSKALLESPMGNGLESKKLVLSKAIENRFKVIDIGKCNHSSENKSSCSYYVPPCNEQLVTFEGYEQETLMFACGFELATKPKQIRKISSNKDFLKIIGR